MKEQDEFDPFEPLIIKGGKFGTPAPEYRLEIAKQTVKAVEFACRYKVKYVIACIILSPTVGGMNMATSLAMDDTDYLENLDGCLPTLEEAEEYEYCAKVIKLKELVPTIKFTRKKLKKSIIDAISEL
jgi:hypothetical protein